MNLKSVVIESGYVTLSTFQKKEGCHSFVLEIESPKSNDYARFGCHGSNEMIKTIKTLIKSLEEIKSEIEKPSTNISRFNDEKFYGGLELPRFPVME